MKLRSSTYRSRRWTKIHHPLAVTALEARINPAGPMLPNLQVYQPDMPSGTITVNSDREIRFTTSLANVGLGAFDLRANGPILTAPDGTQTRVTNQRVYNDDNNNGYFDAYNPTSNPTGDSTYADQKAGEFIYHPTHGHMHFNEFAIARLRVRGPGDTLGPVVAVGPKTSYCLIDLGRPYPTMPGSPTTAQYSCDATQEGISVGWKDVYSSGLPGQFINVTNIPNGDYWLEIECDYANHIQEIDETDNIARTKITIGNQPATGFMVLSSAPLGAQQSSVSYVDFQFNQAVKDGTFTTAAVSFAGPPGQTSMPVSSIEKLSSVLYRVHFPTQGLIGTYQLTLDPTIIRAESGDAMMDQNNNGTGGQPGDGFTHIFVINSPHIETSAPAGSTAGPVAKVVFTYDRPMQSSTLTTADIVSFTGPGGANLLSSISAITPVVAGGQSSSFEVTFTAVTSPGVYSLVIGPNVQDASGNFVDQDQNGVPNEAADNYSNVFTVALAGVYGPDAFGYTAQSVAVPNVVMTSATAINYTNTDDESRALSIGTDKFNFYGSTYTGTDIFASTNGLITFGGSSNAYANSDGLPSIDLPVIGVLWDDWIIGTGSPQVQYLVRNTDADPENDELVIEWNQIRHFQTSTGGVSFQAVLELNTGNRPGKIILNYPDLVQGSSYDKAASATVGLRSSTALNSTLIVSENSNSHPLVAEGKAVLLSVPSVVSITREDANPAPDGDVHFLVTFSDPVDSVDEGDFELTSVGLAGAEIHGVVATGDSRVWEVHVESGVGNGTLRLDLDDNDSIISLAGAKLGGAGIGNGSFAGGQAYTIMQRPPRVLQVTYNDGSAQRSRMTQIEVTFDHIVDLPTPLDAAFQVVGPNGPVGLSVHTNFSSDAQTVAIINFNGPNTEFGSLKDGKYTLTILSTQVSTGGVALDGDDNGSAGGDYTTTFHRLFGDGDGDGFTNLADFAAFRGAFNLGTASVFDFAGDGNVGLDDFSYFRGRFNVIL